MFTDMTLAKLIAGVITAVTVGTTLMMGFGFIFDPRFAGASLWCLVVPAGVVVVILVCVLITWLATWCIVEGMWCVGRWITKRL